MFNTVVLFLWYARLRSQRQRVGVYVCRASKIFGITQRRTSRTTPYHPEGNSQCERLNSTLWKTVKLILHSRGLHEEQWDQVLPDALHAIRSLLCTATNQTPHERFLSFGRRSMLGSSLPAWLLTPGTVLLKRYVRSKSDPLVDPVQLLSANHNFAFIRHADGRESSVSTRDLAPCPTHSPNPAVMDVSPEGELCSPHGIGTVNDISYDVADTSLHQSETGVPVPVEDGRSCEASGSTDGWDPDAPRERPVVHRTLRVSRPTRRWPEDEWTA